MGKIGESWRGSGRLLSMLVSTAILAACFPSVETYMRPSAPGLSSQARDCTGAGTVLRIPLPNRATAYLTTTLSSKWFDFTVELYAPRDSSAHRGNPIQVRATGDIVLEWDGGRFATPLYAHRYDGPGYYDLTKQEPFRQNIRIQNFTAPSATLTLPPITFDGDEMQLPQIMLERRSIPALISINC